VAVTVVARLFKPNAQESVICNKLTMKQPDLKKYAEQMEEMQNLPPASLEISPLGALAIITHIQLASRHPAVGDELTKIARSTAPSNCKTSSTPNQQLTKCWSSDGTPKKIYLLHSNQRSSHSRGSATNPAKTSPET